METVNLFANGGEVNLNSGNLYIIAEGSNIIGDGSNPAVTVQIKLT